jgi:hypothetical protein
MLGGALSKNEAHFRAAKQNLMHDKVSTTDRFYATLLDHDVHQRTQ